MKNVAIVDIIKKSVIFICVLISTSLVLLLFSSIFSPYAYIFLLASINVIITIIFLLIIIAIIAKYVGDIVIVILKSRDE